MFSARVQGESCILIKRYKEYIKFTRKKNKIYDKIYTLEPLEVWVGVGSGGKKPIVAKPIRASRA